jgi:uncharacterized protein
LLGFFELNQEIPSLYISLFSDMKNLLMGDDRHVSCIWTNCDPYTTRAVQGIEGQGQRSNCGRTNKDGVEFVKASTPGFERYIALYHTPQELAGCKDCRFFLMCKGQCPGTAIDNDWRNRSEHCAIWMSIFEMLETQLKEEGITPLSLSPRRLELERQAIDQWSAGRQLSIAQLTGLHPGRQRTNEGSASARSMKDS